jgi:hypothetical protein
MLTDRSVAAFRAWMAKMPPSRWDPPHVRGACDALPKPDKQDAAERRWNELNAELRKLNLQQALGVYGALSGRCDGADQLDELWASLERHVTGPERLDRKDARGLLLHIARKLPAAAVAKTWRRMQPLIDHGDAPRGNGHAV